MNSLVNHNFLDDTSELFKVILPIIELGPEGFELDSVNPVLPEGATSIDVGADGFGKVAIAGRGIGEKSWQGIIKFKDPATKELKPYPFTFNYDVAKPSLVVSPTKMNVLYRGIENPIEISVPGIKQEALTATISTGTLSKKPDGSYIAKVKKGSEAIVKVSADINGKKQNMGQEPFTEKQTRLRDSPYRINQHIAEYDSWNIEHVHDHQKWLAKQATAVWRIAS